MAKKSQGGPDQTPNFGNPFASNPVNAFGSSDPFTSDDPFSAPAGAPPRAQRANDAYGGPFADDSDGFGSGGGYGGHSGGPNRTLLLLLICVGLPLLISALLYITSPKDIPPELVPTLDTGTITSTVTSQADGNYHVLLTHNMTDLDPQQVYVAGFMMAPQGETLVAVNEPEFIRNVTSHTASAQLLITRPGTYQIAFYSYSLLHTAPAITATQVLTIGDGSAQPVQPDETSIIVITPSPSPTPTPTPSPTPSPSPTPYVPNVTPTPTPVPLKTTPSSDLFKLYDINTRYYYQTLTDKQKQTYSEMYDGIANFSKNITLTPCSEADYKLAYAVLKYDTPELFHWDYEDDTVYYTTDISGMRIAMKPSLYTYSQTDFRTKLNQIISEIKSVAARCGSGASDYQIELALYEHVINSCYYDKVLPHCSYADSVYLYEYAKCTGYANALNLALRICGIPCASVIGNTYDNGVIAPTSHMWSVVKIGGKWYGCDATWDEMDELPVSHKYFNINDSLMYKARTIAEEYDLPAPPRCTSLDANYVRKEQVYVTAGSDVHAIVARSMANTIDNGGGILELLFESGADFNTARIQLGNSKIYNQVKKYTSRGFKFTYLCPAAEVNHIYLELKR
ncbi:MAG: hypothetical protein IKU34_03630 [Clostridia bacterium]|nr:hypothetical protein [Clostridia bacterium]